MPDAKFKIGNPVKLYFYEAGTVNRATIVAIIFDESKVYYDVQVSVFEGEASSTILRHIDSAFVQPENYATP